MSINTIDKQDAKTLHESYLNDLQKSKSKVKANENPDVETIPNERRSSHGEAYREVRKKQDDKALAKLNQWFDKDYYESLLD